MPSDPTGDNPNPKWSENTNLNPEGSEYVGFYPDPEVDLNVSYMIAIDNAIVYAPQTEELHDLLTDSALNHIWYTDPGYADFKIIRDNKKQEFESATDRYNDALKNATNALDIVRAEREMNDARTAFDEAQKNLDGVVAYIPDGYNNAFVDIAYSFKDPDGNVIATMNVPHGKAYVVNDGTANIDWNISTKGQVLNEKGNPIISKSGQYTITATVTPVDTNRSPDWHYIPLILLSIPLLVHRRLAHSLPLQ